MKALIIDDELHCRNALTKMIELYGPEITEVDEASDVSEGIASIESFQPDIVFLDIQLDDLTGFQLLDRLKEVTFQLIFVTAFDNYAIKAFEYAAVHYLLKPIGKTALQEAILRCKKSELKYGDEQLENAKGFFLKTHENVYDIVYNEILYVKADGSYSKIYNEDGRSIFTSKKLGDFKKLLNSHFFRIHNSYIVNLKMIESIDQQFQNITLKDGSSLPVSRRKKNAFKLSWQKFRF